ncbi:MAG: MipA/OmpV family protein [Litoreibacter sp.]|uniref:MipA/OmpV family protein n=1 Tax=Litoreibacter sp. TaxID=1969459 RepID=UPI00329876CA
MNRTILITTVVVVINPQLSVAEEAEVGWSYQIVVGVEREAAYTGSDVYVTEAGGLAKATYTAQNGTEWSVGLDGLGVMFRLPKDYEVELTLEYEEGRDNSDDPILSGFPEVQNTVELQGVLTKEFGAYSVGVGVQTDILNRGKGAVAFVGVGYETQLTDRLGLSLGADVSFANSEHMMTEVGVSRATATATGVAAYTPSGGYKGATIEVGLAYALTERSTVYLQASVERYGSNMSDSPLIQTHGSRTNTDVGLGIGFAF